MMLNPQAVVAKIEELERRIQQLENSQIDPHSIVSFTTVAVTGKLNLKPLDMALTMYLTPSGQVAPISVSDYEANVSVLEGVAFRHRLLKEP